MLSAGTVAKLQKPVRVNVSGHRNDVRHPKLRGQQCLSLAALNSLGTQQICNRLSRSQPASNRQTASLFAISQGGTPDVLQSVEGTERVAYQGVPGAFSEMAARYACPDHSPLPCEQFEVAFQALSQWMVDRAVLPIENSLGGSIHSVYDLLLRYQLHIVGETSVAVKHCLMALPGTKISDLKRVMSHPQALAQCDGYLRALQVVREAVDDTAGAGRSVAQQRLQGVGAIASRRAAELYGLEVLDEGIQDFEDNVTRFIVLARDPRISTGAEGLAYKTSIVFALKEGPGQLFRALSVFALRDIDMTKIESRPMRSNPIVLSKDNDDNLIRRFNFLFYIDFIGSLSDPQCQNALRHLQEISVFMRVLGSYPMDTNLGTLNSDESQSLFSSQENNGAVNGLQGSA